MMRAKSNSQVSIIVPTLCRDGHAIQVKNLIKRIQRVTRIPHEIVVVENGSCKSQKCALVTSRIVGQVKVIKIQKEGLSVARNAGIHYSTGDIIVFIDDDVLPSELWLPSIIKMYKNPKVSCVGGPVHLKAPRRSFWFTKYVERFFSPPRLQNYRGPLLPPQYIIGANFSFRREVFLRYGPFDPALGRIGEKLLSGEDVEMVLRLPPEKVFFEPNMKVAGTVSSSKLSFLRLLRRFAWQGISDARITRKHGVKVLFDAPELSISLSLIQSVWFDILSLRLSDAFFKCVRATFFNINLKFCK